MQLAFTPNLPPFLTYYLFVHLKLSSIGVFDAIILC